ncbi:hypothetical protein FACS1894137_15050 [Spirochaetia bacterium]|nr:hypothetical protein FACS1894137_15050 [Spirochaetia bacterium]
MGWGILKAQLSRFGEIGKRVEESSAKKRREGFNLTYEIADAINRTKVRVHSGFFSFNIYQC